MQGSLPFIPKVDDKADEILKQMRLQSPTVQTTYSKCVCRLLYLLGALEEVSPG